MAYDLKKDEFEELKKIIKDFCKVHPEGSKVQYADSEYTVECEIEDKYDRLRLSFENPKSGYFTVELRYKQGEIYRIENSTKGHNLQDMEEAWRLLGVPVEIRSVACILENEKRLAICPRRSEH